MLKNTLTAGVIAMMCAAASPVMAQPDLGAYLAGRQAAGVNDFAGGARYFGAALAADPGNPLLLESALTSFVALGDFEQAEGLAREMVRLRLPSQVADLAINVADAKAGNWDGIFEALESGRSIGPLVDGLTQGWAHMGNGNIRRALGQFDQVIETEGMTTHGITHKAYALASVGDFEGAAALFLSRPGLQYSRKSAIAHIEILSQLGRSAEALALLDDIFGSQIDPGMMVLRDALVAGDAVPFAAVPTPRAGLAEVYITVAGLMQSDAPEAYTLLFARAATHLAPENTPAVLMTAALLEDLGQYDLANVVYAGISRDDPAFPSAELGRAEVLRAAGKLEAAVEVIEALSRSYPDMPQVFARKGDLLRQVDRLDDAKAAYSRALALYGDTAPARWIVLYARAVTNHQLDLWPEAEADFRAALVLQPDNPQILNYLGYSLVERGEKLDEALTMIETAVAAMPDNGAIVDSLGWVLFKLGNYEEAVQILERAATLEPVDPVINDHLGDAYWAVGRTTEARFQWQRALSFNPTEIDAQRIRDKLDRGLDLVLIAEGEEPIRLARGND
ncbi:MULTISPECIES: tetratricopeptide repeat protein [unclassified Yoonia]|uniref:tetratricopeptide repeat protein n=1 Tax=unclassified Yoonia TaxID=2629118 RepID=UPI002AFF5AF8|nr:MULTISPECIES: tetratricopeptide repeat protein [unclassified Yoonia]